MSFFSKIIDEFDGSDELAQAEREALEALAGMAEAKRELFTKEINLLILDAGTGTNKTVPISKVLNSDGMSRAYTSKSAGDIASTLKDAVGGFVEGGTDNIINGIFDILAKTLEIFLGSTAGQEATKVEYFVYGTDYGIYRVDLMAWSRTVKASSLKTKIEQATAYAYTLSNVDIDKITRGDFLAIYGLQLLNVKSLTDKERADARKRMQETWDFLKGTTTLESVDTDAKSIERIESEYRLPLFASNLPPQG